jgi:hypothetical protein
MWTCEDCQAECDDYLKVCAECGAVRSDGPSKPAEITPPSQDPDAPSPKQAPPDRRPIPERPCVDCGSTQIVSGVKVSLSTGLVFGMKLGLQGTQPLLADLCGQCGTVQRLRVANLDRRWLRS